MNCRSNQYEFYNVKMVNYQILHNQQIKKLVPKVEILSNHIKSYKTINIELLKQLVNSHQFSDLINDLKILNVKFNFNDSKSKFPRARIYFNQFFHRDEYFSFTFIIIPEGMQISLHDHSDMFVVTRILQGQLQIEDMDIDRQYINIVKILRSKLQQHRKNKFFIKKNTKPYHPSALKQQIIHSPIINQQFTEQIYQSCIQSSLYQNFDNINCFRVNNWKRTIVSSPAIKILTPITGNIHRLIAKTDCILLNLFLPDYIDEFHCGYYKYDEDGFNEAYPYIFKTKSAKEEASLRDLNQM